MLSEVRVLATVHLLTVDGQVTFGSLSPSALLLRLCLALNQVPHCSSGFLTRPQCPIRAGKGEGVRAETCVLFAVRFWRMF